MVLLLLILFSCGVVDVPSSQHSATTDQRQDRTQEVNNLLKQLLDMNNGDASVIRKRVCTQLVQIAGESPASRKQVIDALKAVLNDPMPESNIPGVFQWRTAINLLGELKATEAVEDLVRNLDHTGHEGDTLRGSPVRTALVRIGKPAIPPLLRALSNSNEFIRIEASEALGEIGEPSVDGLLNELVYGISPARASAAHALARIGGVRSREAIERSLQIETDEEVRKYLESAIAYMDHVECLKDPNKCK